VRNDNVQASVLVLVGLLTVSVPLFAHHGNASTENKTVVMKATVTAWLWTNPHSFLMFDVKDDGGNVVHWSGEWNAPSTLVNFGFTAKTFKVGDEVTVTLSGVAKTGAPIGRLKSVLLPSGQLMTEDESIGKSR
jgi:cell shape-determining protein MreC